MVRVCPTSRPHSPVLALDPHDRRDGQVPVAEDVRERNLDGPVVRRLQGVPATVRDSATRMTMR